MESRPVPAFSGLRFCYISTTTKITNWFYMQRELSLQVLQLNLLLTTDDLQSLHFQEVLKRTIENLDLQSTSQQKERSSKIQRTQTRTQITWPLDHCLAVRQQCWVMDNAICLCTLL